MTKAGLEALLASDNLWSGYATLVLAVGILGEYVILPFFDKTKGRTLYFGFKLLFAIMVVVGVFGEYRYSSRIADDAGRIQKLSDDEVIQAERSAEVAERQSKVARDRAASAEHENTELRRDLNATKGALISRQEELAREQQKAANAQRDAAEAQRKLNEAIVTRILGRQVDVRFAANLKLVKPGKADVLCAEDSEARWYAILTLNALREAKWNVPRDPTPIPLARFDARDLPLFGNRLSAKNVRTAYMPFGSKGTSPSIIARLIGSTDIRIGVLASGIGIDNFVQDSNLADGEFKILIGPRDPTR